MVEQFLLVKTVCITPKQAIMTTVAEHADIFR